MFALVVGSYSGRRWQGPTTQSSSWTGGVARHKRPGQADVFAPPRLLAPALLSPVPRKLAHASVCCEASQASRETGGARVAAVIENPIHNSPFTEPARHFVFDDDGITSEISEGRRRSTYFFPATRSASG